LAEIGKTSLLAPFRVPSFRFQWPADLLTSWAFEMETLILGWYVLVETGSVLWLTAFGSLQFLGTLIAPMFGVLGDRVGRRTMLCTMRAIYAALAAVLTTLGLLGVLSPVHVFAVAALAGLVRPSDLVMRNALIGDTMAPERLMSAMGVSRTTMDSARIAGALVGAGLFAALGIGAAYICVTAFYLTSFALTLGVSKVGPAHAVSGAAVASPWRELKEGLAYIWATPELLALMWLAFLVNLTAFPVSHGLLPYVAREIYLVDENGLGQLVAAFAVGALIGSLAMAWRGGPRRRARFMLVNILLWYLLLLGFGQLESKLPGAVLLLLLGFFQGIAMISMSVALLAAAGPRFRARVMGVRMLAVYGLPVGLMASNLFVGWLGFSGTVAVYGATGIVFTLLIAVRWRRTLWR
jgi:MFS family permease